MSVHACTRPGCLPLVICVVACGGSGGGAAGPPGPQPPGSPSGVTATADIRSAQVSWSEPSSPGGAPIIDYTVTAAPGGATATVTGLTATVGGLANGTRYTFTVAARNAGGMGASSAPSVPVTTPDVPGPPTGLVVSAADRSAVARWRPATVNGGPQVFGYMVTLVPPVQGALIQVGDTSAAIYGLANGATYSVRVAAINLVGDGPVAAGPVTPALAPCPSCRPGTLAGLAAAGQPLRDGTLVLLGSNGATAVHTVAADGTYRASVDGLTAPYLIKVAGTVAGRPVVLHSIASADDVATRVVNVTPLTELVAALALRGDPEAPFSSVTPNLNPLAAVNDGTLALSSFSVWLRLQPLLAAFVPDWLDLRTAAIAADGTGLDLALDAFSLDPLVDPATRAISYRVTIRTSGATVTVVPTWPSGTPVAFTAADAAALQAARTDLASIRTRLADLASRFAAGLPAAGDLLPFLAPDFHHDGLDGAAWMGKVALSPRPTPDGFDWVGLSVTGAALQRWIDVDTLEVSFGLEVGPRGTGGSIRYPPWQQSMTFRRGASGWLLAGNGRPGGTRVTYMVRIKEQGLRALELDNLIARGVGSIHLASDGHYYMVLQDVPNPGATTEAWIGFPGDRNPFFAVLGWVFDSYDDPATPTLNERALRRQYIQYLGATSFRVSAYLVFEVSSVQLDPAVARAIVSGPGLPDGGLSLVRAPAAMPRNHLVFEGDAAAWDAFNTERCIDMTNSGRVGDTRPVIPGCGLDWSKVSGGTVFHLDFRDAGEVTIGTVDEPVQGRPDDELSWSARRAAFPQFTLSAGQEPSYFNILDDTPGAPWGPFGTATLAWTPPADPTVKLVYVTHNRQYFEGDAYTDPTQQRQEMTAMPLWDRTDGTGAPLTSASRTFTTGFLTNWAWATLEARDAFGNALQHEVSPVNPR